MAPRRPHRNRRLTVIASGVKLIFTRFGSSKPTLQSPNGRGSLSNGFGGTFPCGRGINLQFLFRSSRGRNLWEQPQFWSIFGHISTVALFETNCTATCVYLTRPGKQIFSVRLDSMSPTYGTPKT